MDAVIAYVDWKVCEAEDASLKTWNGIQEVQRMLQATKEKLKAMGVSGVDGQTSQEMHPESIVDTLRHCFEVAGKRIKTIDKNQMVLKAKQSHIADSINP